MTDPTPAAAPAAPTIRITSGSATPEEVAALTVLLSAMAGSAEAARSTVRQGWARPSRRFAAPTHPAMGWGRR